MHVLIVPKASMPMLVNKASPVAIKRTSSNEDTPPVIVWRQCNIRQLVLSPLTPPFLVLLLPLLPLLQSLTYGWTLVRSVLEA